MLTRAGLPHGGDCITSASWAKATWSVSGKCWDGENGPGGADRWQQWTCDDAYKNQEFHFWYYACYINGTSCQNDSDCCSGCCMNGYCGYNPYPFLGSCDAWP